MVSFDYFQINANEYVKKFFDFRMLKILLLGSISGFPH